MKQFLNQFQNIFHRFLHQKKVKVKIKNKINNKKNNTIKNKNAVLTKRQGFTLPELVISIVVISIAVLGTLLGIRATVRHSADPMITQQAVAIAESYLEEIAAKPFPTAALPCSGTPPALRADYATICDYKGIPSGGQVPTDIDGNPVAGLGGYTVRVVIDDTTADVNGLTSAANQAMRIDVTLSHPNMTDMMFSVYRTRY